MRPYSPRVPRRSLDVKVLGVIASIFHIVQRKAFRHTLWQWLFYLSPSVRRTAAASERSQPPILPSHCPVLNEQVLLNAAGQTLIFALSPSMDSPWACRISWVKKEIHFLSSFLPCRKTPRVLPSISTASEEDGLSRKTGKKSVCLHLNDGCSWCHTFAQPWF